MRPSYRNFDAGLTVSQHGFSSCDSILGTRSFLSVRLNAPARQVLSLLNRIFDTKVYKISTFQSIFSIGTLFDGVDIQNFTLYL